jgi:lipopolysaccharide transport system permease protein/teichoic acid transport system permease protein
MAWHEIRARYLGTIGGFLWTVANPLVTIFVYWFVFAILFKSTGENDLPFIVPFACGYIPWMTFSEILSSSCASVISKSHLVTKTIFPTEILPVVSIVSALITHLILLVVLVFILIAYGLPPSIDWLQIGYYLFALSALALGFGWFLAAVNVFFTDTFQITGIVLNIWFWSTPIVWFPTMAPDFFQKLLWLNPMYYLVEGYRDSFMRHGVFFWEKATENMMFWVTCMVVISIGAFCFNRLKPEFSEML